MSLLHWKCHQAKTEARCGCMPAGRKQVEPGEKLRFKSKAALREALAERRARQQAGQQQPQVVVVDAALAGERSVMLETAKWARCA